MKSLIRKSYNGLSFSNKVTRRWFVFHLVVKLEAIG